MSDLMTDSQQQTNSRVFKSPLVSFSTVTGSGRFVSGMKQFRDANPDLCNEVTEQKAWAISPTVVQITEGFNSREMGMGKLITSCQKSPIISITSRMRTSGVIT